jgi:hypothetical protein
MDLNTVIEFLKQFETKKVLSYLGTLNLQELVKNPYFLGGTGLMAVIAFLMRWRLLLVVILSIAGVVYMLAYMATHGTSVEGGGGTESLFVFVVIGSAIVFLIIYFLFIRHD